MFQPGTTAGYWKIKISRHRLDSQNIFLYHKTTNRKLYDTELTLAKKQGFDEVIFLNQKNQVCEGAISNIFIEKNKKLLTPKLSCGLLPGSCASIFLKPAEPGKPPCI